MTKQHLPYFTIPLFVLLISCAVFTGSFTPNENSANSPTSIQNSPFNTLVWSDEFSGTGAIDSEKWFLQTQLPPGGSWWGGLIQHYTDRTENTYVENGHLNLVAKKEKFRDQGKTKEYTSARLNSKFAFTYGRIEIRAKLPKGIGTWPAIWMLNTNIDEDGAYWENKGFGTTKWPHCGEIDILEHWGKNQDYVSSAVHNGSSYGDYVENLGGQTIENASDEFHIYTLEWTKEKLAFSVDGVEHYQYSPEVKDSKTWPYNSDYYLILNIAIQPDIDPNFMESAMVVDYIRIFQ
ncbi:glycoside hydrolase family 16 protein [Flagellimonas allohymeniacidonis]|uniref:Glycoside hydrolase family 16 protein n=1 Tax=Flagellimonas allohymeniacidonis TaxID=2517819 RepID=A0A4Q8QHB4_9FLAO|nr:glycoside hydrolase family 16 protein [Allomuricauda hymeniacidonis]TAI47819.1 glycoside hydrolase family 16 protein [Allomuricauda hymeniacidonis]